jgi:hypothetical protein
MKCDAVTILDGGLKAEVRSIGRCGCRASQFILFSRGMILFCRCERHQIKTQFEDVRFLTEEEALVHSTMNE